MLGFRPRLGGIQTENFAGQVGRGGPAGRENQGGTHTARSQSEIVLVDQAHVTNPADHLEGGGLRHFEFAGQPCLGRGLAFLTEIEKSHQVSGDTLAHLHAGMGFGSAFGLSGFGFGAHSWPILPPTGDAGHVNRSDGALML